MLGKRVTRKAKVVYAHTPEWEYYDLRKRAPYVGWDSSSYHLEVLAIPEEFHDDGTVTEGTPHWERLGDIIADDVLPHEMWDAVIDAVDEQCKAEDMQRRRAAGLIK